MKTTRLFLCLFLALGSLPVLSQNRFMMLPAVVNIDALMPVAEGHIHFSGDPVAWTATVASGWLRMQPMSGVGPTNLLFEADVNEGPRRQATVTFTSVDGTVEPFVVEARQYQNLPADAVVLSFNTIEYVNPPVEPMMPSVGVVNTSFFPAQNAGYFSLLGRLGPEQVPVWLVRNAWMASAELNPDRQSLSHLFNLAELGLEPGMPVGDIFFAWTWSLDGDTLMPWVPDYAWTPYPLTPDFFQASGRPEGSLYTLDTVPDFWPILKLPYEISHVVYIGCDMPNGDLNGTTSSGYDINGCGPAAAANSLNWLEKEHDGVDIPGGWREAFEQLGTLMGRDSGGTVGDRSFIRAKLDFIEMYDLPIKVKYQASTAEGNVDSSTGNSSAADQDGAAGDQPAKDWMTGEMEDDEDVEVGVGYPGGGGHWVTATGTITINGQTYLFFKHDADQTKADSTKQQESPITENGSIMTLPGLADSRIEIVVSESFDPKHVPVPASETFGSYCKSFKRVIPPRSSITITYPENPDRCFNTSVRVLNRAESGSYVNEAVWNFNSGTTRTYHNSTGQPVIVEFHNDDYYDGGPPLKTYPEYTVSMTKYYEQDTLPSDPSNEDFYAGFSIGTNDDSSEEFGEIKQKEVMYVHRIGSRLEDFPAGMSGAGVHKLTIRYVIPRWNRYWMNLGLELGIAEVLEPVDLIIECPATGFSDTLQIDEKGKKFVELGGAGVVSFFDISLSLSGSGGFSFDNLGVPSLVQIQPTIDLEPAVLQVNANMSGDTLFHISNLGGSDMFWTLSESSDWFDIAPQTGINDSDAIVTYQANTGPSREATVRLDAPGARNSPQYLIVRQDSAASFIDLVRHGQLKVDLFPNPNQGEFTLTLTSSKTGPTTIRILDTAGKCLRESHGYLDGFVWQTTIRLPGLSSGNYFVVVEVAGSVYVGKLAIGR